jgi:toxin ParE1/3/4
MGYSIKISPSAQKEIENAIDFYALYSYDTPVKFIAALQETYTDYKYSLVQASRTRVGH